MRRNATPLVLMATLVITNCGGNSDETDSAAAIDRTLVAQDLYNDWVESSTETAESLDLAIEDVVDRNCIDAAVAILSDDDAEYLTTLARGDIPEGDLTDAGYDVMDQVRDCVDFTGG